MMLQPRNFFFSRPNSSKSKENKYDRPMDERKNKASEKSDQKTMSISSTPPSDPERPTTPSIPILGSHEHERKRTQGRKERPNTRKESDRAQRRAQTVHSPDAIPPSVAALLAITSIPPQKNGSLRARSGAGQRLTVDAIMKHTGVSEKDYAMSMGKSPLDFLLSPPEDEDEIAESENGLESVMSTRTLSSESMPSLDNDSIHESPSLGSLVTPGSSSPRGKRIRRIQSPTSTQGCSSVDHPLYVPEIDLEQLDFRVFQNSFNTENEKLDIKDLSPRPKSAFKSNLTASLRALRSAAKSFSSLTAPMITPDDFLTRSIISIDPSVPFTDERMPPRLEDTPTPALRRYLNPTTNAPIEAHIPTSQAQTMRAPECTASIQMQTYKVSRSKTNKATTVISRRTQATPEQSLVEVAAGPLARQRDMRENSDFIRVAVMEMLMRKRGKLDDQKPGRARWALPPRVPPTKPYEISEDGVPVRWIAVTH